MLSLAIRAPGNIVGEHREVVRDNQIVLDVRPRPVRHVARLKARSSFVIRAFRCLRTTGTPAAASRHIMLNATNSAPHQLRNGPKSSPAPEAAAEIRIAPNAKQRLAPFWAAMENCVCHQRLRAKPARHTNDHAARVASPSALRQAGTSETRAQCDPVSSLKCMGIVNPSRREHRADGKRRRAFGDRTRAGGQSPKGGWSPQTPLAHKEKGPARDLFSGLQCASGG